MNDFERTRYIALMLAALCLYACLLAIRALTAARTAYNALDDAERHMVALTLENRVLYASLAEQWLTKNPEA